MILVECISYLVFVYRNHIIFPQDLCYKLKKKQIEAIPQIFNIEDPAASRSHALAWFDRKEFYYFYIHSLTPQPIESLKVD